MNIKRNLLTALLSLSLLCTAVVPAFAADAETDALLTRAELVTQLHEAAGEPVVDHDMNYSDVSADADCAEAIRWASSENLVTGFEDGTFRPDSTLTREQLAVILYRCAQENDQGFTGAWAFRLPYSDASQIHDYAYEAVCWVTMHKIMGAAEGEAFAPEAAVSASDTEAILAQFTAVLEQA